MEWTRSRLSFSAIMAVLLIPIIVGVASSQGLPQSPYSAPSVVRGGLDLAPSNPTAMPRTTAGPIREVGSILVTPQMFPGIFPAIPNLQVGYQHYFGKSVSTGRLTLDYLLPVSLGSDSVFFGESHAQFTDFWKTIERWLSSDGTNMNYRGVKERLDLSFGGGVRKIFWGNTLVGFNGFYDATRLGNRWYKSGSAGLEFAALLPGDDVVDFNFNWYGRLFNSDVLANAFRRGPDNFDLQAGYTRELWRGGPDLRLGGTAYRFQPGRRLWGGKGSAEIKTSDGMFSLKYELAYDDMHKTYHMVGANMNLAFGFQWTDGSIGFTYGPPEPIFRGPRNFRRRLTQPLAHRRSTAPGSILVRSRASSNAGQGNCNPQIVRPTASWLVSFAAGITSTPQSGVDFNDVSWSDLNVVTCNHTYDSRVSTANIGGVIVVSGFQTGTLDLNFRIYAVGVGGTPRVRVAGGSVVWWGQSAGGLVLGDAGMDTDVSAEINRAFINTRTDIDRYELDLSGSNAFGISAPVDFILYLEDPTFNAL